MLFCMFNVPSGDNNKVENRLKWEFEPHVVHVTVVRSKQKTKKKKTTRICENSVYKRRRHLRISISRDPTRAPG
jgi:ferredoxin-like protein FixX